jgi:diadenosine tetraphosphate (Ap4A) HIT family hydrolase
MNCELCASDGGIPLWRDDKCRVVRVTEPGYPGYLRVIWHAHVREMTDLDAADRDHIMRVVFRVESVLRETLKPLKINLACFGNMTPHLHWHVIARFPDDPHFPEPVWGKRQRDVCGIDHRLSDEQMIGVLATALQ